MFLITLVFSSLYHTYDVYESIIHFIMSMILHLLLTYAFVHLIDTSLPTFKIFIKDSCGRLIVLLDYVKNLVDDIASPNLPNPIIPNFVPNFPIPNPMLNSPPINPSSSHTYDGIQAIV